MIVLFILHSILCETVERALPENNIRGIRRSKKLVDGSKITVDTYYGVRYGTASRWGLPVDALQRNDHTKPEEVPYCPQTSSFNSTEDCLTLDLYIPKDFSGDSLIIYLPPYPANSPYAPATLAWYDASIPSAKLNSGKS